MLLPAFSDAREFLGKESMSYSEISKLGHCEMAWKLIYDAEREPNEPTDAMALGSEMHRLLGEYWMVTAPFTPVSENETAQWLIDRYDQHYGDQQASHLKMVATEIPFAQKHNGVYIFGWMDGIVQDLDTGELWITEFKTMGNWSKLNQLPVDKQVTLYIWAARAAGYNVKGVMYDAIRTYRWTGKNADSHEPAESFQRLWIERTDEEIRQCLDEVESAIGRRADLFINIDVPIRNVGMHCDWCPVMPKCYGIDLTLQPECDELGF